MKLGKRILAGAVSMAMTVSALASEGFVSVAASPDGTFTEKNILTASGNALVSNSSSHYENESYNGYIQTNYATDTTLVNSDYLRVTFTVEGDFDDETVVFNLQPFDKSWGGWNDNFITMADADYDTATGVYTAYYSTQKIIQSLNTGKDLNGINISFKQAEPVVTLKSYACLTASETGGVELSETDFQLSSPKQIFYITGQDLKDAGVDADNIYEKDADATIYVHVEKANVFSRIRASAGSVTKGSSNRALVGSMCTIGSDGKNYIQNSDNNDGVGLAGTANYKFPACSTKKSVSMEDMLFKITVYTKDTEVTPLGIIFSSGESVTINADGTLTNGFTAPVCEDTALDPEEGVVNDVWEQTVPMRRDNLKLTLDYIATMDESLYTAESWEALMDAVVVAKAEYDNASATVDSLKKARDELEYVKASLIFVNDDADDSNAMPFRELTPEQVVAEMGVGINLGNTLDGHSGFTPNETSWQSVTTTKAYIKALHDAGYNTVRIPVTWGTMIDDENDYAINEAWISRVQDIVDYCIEQDMYAIINIHHDGAEQTGWLRVAADDIDEVMYKFECVWRNIAEYFKDYDEHLIFESMNEISCSDTDKNGAKAVAYDTPIIVNFNQLFVNVVRSTGSNNTKRWLAAVSHYANNGSSNLFTLPEDSYNEDAKIMFAAHIYSDAQGTADRLKAMAKKFKGVPMYLGEYGSKVGESDRRYLEEVTAKLCQVAGVCPVVWDQGYGTKGKYESGLFTYWDRADCVSLHETVTDAMIRGYYVAASEENKNFKFSDIPVNDSDVVVTPITEITVDEKVELTIGEEKTLTATFAPENTNDVVLWSTDNDNVATVFNGKISATGIGKTTIHVYSQNGEVKKDIAVTVKPEESDEKVEITTDKDVYTVVLGKGVNIEASASNGKNVTFESLNEEIATVNSLGKIVGVKLGSAQVVITTTTGVTKTVTVVVKDALTTDEIELALKVLYNDSSKSYWGTETGTSVIVNGDGQYTVKFDIAEHLSKDGKKAGIDSISNLTAIYIQDETVSSGNATKSPLTSVNIRYDEIKVDGRALTITKGDFKSALKANGVFDTNDPINSWDGSAVEEVSSVDHVANFVGIKPTTIEITFTLSDMVFVESEPTRENPVEKLKADEDKFTFAEGEIPESFEVKVKANPTDTDSLIAFVSGDKSIAEISQASMNVDENGYVTAVVTILKAENVTIYAVAENGIKEEIEVVFGSDEPKEDDPSTDNPTDEPTDKPSDGNGDSNTNTGLATMSLCSLAMAGVVACASKKRRK